jgi:hypothetical protein
VGIAVELDEFGPGRAQPRPHAPGERLELRRPRVDRQQLLPRAEPRGKLGKLAGDPGAACFGLGAVGVGQRLGVPVAEPDGAAFAAFLRDHFRPGCDLLVIVLRADRASQPQAIEP